MGRMRKLPVQPYNYGTKFGLKAIAEGAETQAHVNFLQKHRCDEIQGFYYSRPLAIDEFTSYYQSFNKDVAAVSTPRKSPATAKQISSGR